NSFTLTSFIYPLQRVVKSTSNTLAHPKAELLSLTSMASTLYMPTIHLGYEIATMIGCAASGVFRGSASTVSTESESNSYSTIAECKAETTPQSIPSPCASGGYYKPVPITMHLKDLVCKDSLAAFHLHKALQDIDGECLKPEKECKHIEAGVAERVEEEDELGVLLISGSDDSGSDSYSDGSDTDLEYQVSEEDCDYSPLSDSLDDDDESDYPSSGPMVFWQSNTDYLLNFERMKYKAAKHARTQRHSMTYPSVKAPVFTAYVYKFDEIERGDSPQKTPSKDRGIFMRAWRKNQERMSKEPCRFWNIVNSIEEAPYDADDDSR
ncbi:hypothetical protein EV426DRAFT_670317, partial [Tirmania nivea]